MRRVVLTASLCVCLGCQSTPNQVHFIIPNGFRGAFAVKADDSEGIIVVKEGGLYVVRIPESGVLGIKDHDPFQSYLCTASFANGNGIWVSTRIDDTPRKEQIALWGGTTEAWYENGKPVNLFWWFVGTEGEWSASDQKTRHSAGGVPRKSENCRRLHPECRVDRSAAVQGHREPFRAAFCRCSTRGRSRRWCGA
jgi:hypothetical protein